MQYVRNLSDSVSTAWNSINPATLSGAIDVIVVEAPDGTLSCSPFHVRFGKFSLLRPYEKKVEFRVNGKKQDHAMKLAEGGEAFFVFETSETIPQALQTSPPVSPASSPPLEPERPLTLVEPPPFDLEAQQVKPRASSFARPPPTVIYSTSVSREKGRLAPFPTSPELHKGRPVTGDWSNLGRPHSEEVLRMSARKKASESDLKTKPDTPEPSDRSQSPPPINPRAAVQRAISMSRGLEAVNIPTKVTESGDLMLDMTGFKHNEEDALRAEVLARKVLSEELQGNYDIGALFGLDEQGNLWIYSSEEAKDAAMEKTMASTIRTNAYEVDAVSDPGYHSDDSSATASPPPLHRRSESDVGQLAMETPPSSPGSSRLGNDPNVNYAKTLRLTSDQLKELDLRPGENSMSFTVNKATCSAFMFLWKHETPVVISDIDGTITKSDALGQVLHVIGRDWTHAGVAKLYSDIITNGYNIMYLTSRSVGQADMTRAYLAGITQGGFRLPRGPTILSPDRTMAALRREVYLRKPHIFKMATLRDIRNLYGPEHHPFYAGFGNRLTDQISYRTVDVPRTRIFTINSNAEVSLDLLSLNKLKLNYVNMSEVVDHYFPPVSTIVRAGGEDYTDFTYWRDTPLDLNDFSASDTESDRGVSSLALSRSRTKDSRASLYTQGTGEVDDDDDDGDLGDLGDSYISRNSIDDYGEGSVLSGDAEVPESMMNSIIEYEDDEGDEGGDEHELDEDDGDDDDNNNGRGGAIDRVDSTPRLQPVRLPRGESTASGVSTTTLAPPKNDKMSRTPSPGIAVKDEDAESITGMKGLSVVKTVD